MSGPWPHPKTGILYYRKVTPPELFSSRLRLAEMGVTVTREVQRSLGTRDRKPAERRYVEVSREVETMWDRWRSLLADGPKELSHKDIIALAGADAVEYVRRYSDDPQYAVGGPSKMLAATLANIHAHFSRQSLRDGQEVFELGQQLQGISTPELPGHVVELLRTTQPGPRRETLDAVARLLVTYRETFGWLRAKKITDDRGIAITRRSRKALGNAAADFRQRSWETLEAYLRGDYREAGWVAGLPTVHLWERSSAPDGNAKGLSLGYLLDHKAGTQSMRSKTVRDIRTYLDKLSEFVGHDDARRIAKDDIRRWRDSLTASDDLSPKTVNGRYLSAVSSVLAHGVREFDLPSNVAAGIRDNRAVEPPSGPKGYSEEQATKILRATFAGSAKALSEPHKRAIRWVPWILAYTGLRVTEVTQFQVRNVREEGGVPFLLITPEDGSTKSGKAWAVGIHGHLIELGLLSFLRSCGTGPVFYEAYPDGTDLKALGGRHRAQESAGRVSKWITSEVGIKAPLGRPNHAWRHLFTTRSRACGMDKEARDFMMGSGPVDARESYGDWPPAVLDAEINKLPRLAVKETGWRPSLPV